MQRLKNKTFSINIQGCRTNQYEGEAITFALEKAGAVYNETASDIFVIVSCTITAAAERKCRKLIRKVRREMPAALIVVCGCYAQKLTDEERKQFGIDILVGSRLKYKLSEIIANHFEFPEGALSFSFSEQELSKERSWDSLELDRPRLHTRAFLKVQDGCNHFCSYCIVPYVRGNPVSRDIDESVAEATKIVESGCTEIVLTGIHLGLYENLDILVRRIGKIKGIKRLRFGSIEPFAVTEKLLNSLAETEIFCHHLHMPLQSANDEVLKIMRRGYTANEYRKVVDNVRSRLGNRVHISTDLMIGFPTEDDVAFRNSINFLKEIKFGKIHVFPYSRREGTDAAQLALPQQSEIRERKIEALAVADELHKEYCSSWIGEKVSILVEEKKDGIVGGLAANYIRVAAQDRGEEILDIVDVTPKKYSNGTLICAESLDRLFGLDSKIEIL